MDEIYDIYDFKISNIEVYYLSSYSHYRLYKKSVFLNKNYYKFENEKDYAFKLLN